MKISNKNWVKVFLLLTISVPLSAGVFNLIVDPYGLYRVYEKKGFNQQKEGVRSKIRFVKSLEVAQRQPKTLLLGSSRVHDGLNPQSKVLDNMQPVYNLGIPMVTIKELKKYFEHAVHTSEIKTVIIGLDFVMFNKYQKLNVAYDESYFDLYFGKLVSYAKTLFIRAAFEDSLRTIKISKGSPGRKEFLESGYRPGEHVFYGVKSYEKLHLYIGWIFMATKRPGRTLYYSPFGIDKEAYNDFAEILKICDQEKINCKFFISPVHVTLGEIGVNMAGLTKQFNDWKKKLSVITAESGFQLWDFSGYNTITMEKVQTPMQYYWDLAHYKEIVGEYILERILLNKSVNVSIPDDFGGLITPQNIDDHIQKIHEFEQLYKKDNKDYLEVIYDLYKRALAGEPQDLSALEGMF